MEKNLNSYIKIYDNWLDLDVCDTTVKDLEKVNWSKHLFYNNNSDTLHAKSGDKELDISYDMVSTNNQIMKRIWDSYLEYVKEFNFDWFQGWSGHTLVRYNRYLENRVMAKHCDHINDIFDGTRKGIPVLTSLGALNDDYEGGEFVMFDDDVIEIKKGSIIVFPSNFLYPHKIEPVTKGIRYSYVSWAW